MGCRRTMSLATGLARRKAGSVRRAVGANPHGNRLHYLRHNGPEHILAFAPTRSGKGVGLVIPTLLAWSESAVVYDIKGENWAKTAGFRQAARPCLLQVLARRRLETAPDSIPLRKFGSARRATFPTRRTSPT